MAGDITDAAKLMRRLNGRQARAAAFLIGNIRTVVERQPGSAEGSCAAGQAEADIYQYRPRFEEMIDPYFIMRKDGDAALFRAEGGC